MRSETRFRLKELVNSILKNKGLTQEKLSELVGCSNRNVEQILSGFRNLTIKKAIVWEKILGVTAENLLYSQLIDQIAEEKAMQRGDLEGHFQRVAEMRTLEEVS